MVSVKGEIVNYEKEATALYKAIENKKWEEASDRCKKKPNEARIWVYRRNPNRKTIRWCVLPIHQACARNCPEEVMKDLLAAYPNAVKKKSFQMKSEKTAPKSVDDIDHNEGNLPIHFACEWGVPSKVVSMLLSSFPESVNILDRRGLTPSAIARKAKYENKVEIIAEIDKIESAQRMKSLESQVQELAKKLSITDLNNVSLVSQPPSSRQVVSTTEVFEAKINAIEAEKAMLQAQNDELTAKVEELNNKISTLSTSLETILTSQSELAKMAVDQETILRDVTERLKQDVVEIENEHRDP